MPPATPEFPAGRRFAFSILDDTDDSTLENARPVYTRLRELGFRTTKTVWPMDCPEGSENYFAADTLQRKEYLEFTRALMESGFEIASHGATMESSERERTLRGFAFLEAQLGARPRLHANHGENRENLYWGSERFRTRSFRRLLRGRDPTGASPYFCGEREDSAHFWGDLSREHIEYVRNFTFRELNALRFNPEMPYQTSDTPYVAHWFSTSDAPNAESFLQRVSQRALDRLEAEGGVCILSTHLGKGYARDGRLDPDVDERLTYLAAKPGWFVPVSTILDHLRQTRSDRRMGRFALARLETRFLLAQARERATQRGIGSPS